MKKKMTRLLLLLVITSFVGMASIVQGKEISEGVQTEGIICFYQDTAESEAGDTGSTMIKKPSEKGPLPQTGEKRRKSLSFIGAALLLLLGVFSYCKRSCLKVLK